MTIEVPPHDFAAACSTMADDLTVTPALQRWAGQAADVLAAAGHRIPTDLERVRKGQTLTRIMWIWLVDEVQNPRRYTCPF